MKNKKIKSYDQAMKDLQEIAADLQNNKISMDDLPDKVEYASELIEYCKGKLRGVEEKLG